MTLVPDRHTTDPTPTPTPTPTATATTDPTTDPTTAPPMIHPAHPDQGAPAVNPPATTNQPERRSATRPVLDLPTAIAVIGTGYVGLTTGAGFALLGHRVVCVDVDAAKVARLAAGECPILEAGLPEALAEGSRTRRLRFTTDAVGAVAEAEVVFLCLPTPEGADGSADVSAVLDAAAVLAPDLRQGTVVVTKSTVPVGTARRVRAAIGRDDIDVVSNPEFLREGTALQDFLGPDRIVVGADRPEAAQRVADLYRDVASPVVICGTAAAETIKYASNAFLATKVAFANTIAELCAAVDADAVEVLAGVGMDPRIGSQFLQPGPGYGGSCFGKDTKALVAIGRSVGLDMPIVEATIRSNVAHMSWVVDRVEQFIGRPVAGLRIAVWGLTFKAGTDDLRDSPALYVVEQLRARGAEIAAYDPGLDVDRPDVRLQGIERCTNLYNPCIGASALVVLTEWSCFAEADLDKVAELLSEGRVFDARRVLDPRDVRAAGLELAAVGR
jgi:UDPglucose 6-dehydrogenase